MRRVSLLPCGFWLLMYFGRDRDRCFLRGLHRYLLISWKRGLHPQLFRYWTSYASEHPNRFCPVNFSVSELTPHRIHSSAFAKQHGRGPATRVITDSER